MLKEFCGGEPVDWWYDRLRRRTPRTPAAREFDALAELCADGLPVPQPLALFEERTAPGWLPPRRSVGPRSAVLIESIAVRVTLVEALEAAPADERRLLLDRLLELVADFHRRGWYHRDLYLGHLVLDRSGRMVLLDLGRARRERRPRQRWFVKDLAALLGSAPMAVTRAERLRFLIGWLDRVGLRESGRRAWVRRVSAKAARLMSHRPRHDGAVPTAAAARGSA